MHLFISCNILTLFSLPSPSLPPPPSLCSICHCLWLFLVCGSAKACLCCCGDCFLTANPLMQARMPLLMGPPPPNTLPSDTPDCPGSHHPFTCHPDRVTPTPGKISRCALSKTQRPEWGDWQGAGPLRTQGRCQVAKKREMIDFRVKLKIKRMCFNTPLADSSFCGTRKRGVAFYSRVPSVCSEASLPTSERVN